jgi:alkylation response protein AidB-like acyl-CoA dehydrogenase
MHVLGEFPGSEWAETTASELEKFADTHRKELDAAEKAGRLPREVYREMGARGWVGCITPPEFGGAGGGVREYCLIEEEVGRNLLVSPQISVQGQYWLLHWGSDLQRERYLAGIASGDLIFSESISEPGAGSSLRTLGTTAVRDGSDWLINGHKTHVNLGAESDVTLVYASTELGLTAFFVDRGTPGFSAERTDPVGLRLIPTAEMRFDDVRVPADAVLGAPGKGLETFLGTFNTSRLGNASELIGFARRAMGDAIGYGSARAVGDNVVTDFQGIRWTVADVYADIYAASLARDLAAQRADEGAGHEFETSLAKKLAIDAAERAANECFALVGGHGLYTAEQYARLLLDVKVLRVAGGSLEILRNHIARTIFKESSYRGLA